MNVLGIHDGHNATAALVRDGRVVAAIQEERLSRIKNHDTFPARAIERVLAMGGCAPGDVDIVAMNGAHQPRHRTREELIHDIKAAGSESVGSRLKRAARQSPINTLFRGMRKREREKEAAACGLPDGRIVFVDHHEAHAAAAYWGAPFRLGGDGRDGRDGHTGSAARAAAPCPPSSPSPPCPSGPSRPSCPPTSPSPVLVLTCDGAGDDLCATVSVAQAGHIERRFEIAEEHSIGMVYLTVTQLLGMVPNEHEYKLMGLAPYAKEKQVEACLDRFAAMMEFEGGGKPVWRRRDGVPHAFALYQYLRDRLEGFRFDTIAGALQRWTETMLCEWTRRAIAATGLRSVALSGGVFMNVKANKAIAELPEVSELFIFPSCGDETNAISAALAAYAAAREGALPEPEPIGPIYWGESFSSEDIARAIDENGAGGAGFTVHLVSDPGEKVASLLADGQIVARFDGRAEFGARALGNRSILADASRPEVVRELNEAIKNRDFWMPFAATVLAERAGDYVVNPKSLAAPYMMLAFDTTRGRRADIRAAIHPYDETIRPQILAPGANPPYHALLKAFEAKTGRGALLNTSFNLHGSPMVYSPSDALQVLRASSLRCLLLGDVLVEKR